MSNNPAPSPTSSSPPAAAAATSSLSSLWGSSVNEDEVSSLESQLSSLDIPQLQSRIKMLDNNIRVMKSEDTRLSHETKQQLQKIDENKQKIKMNKQLPYLVSNVIEILELDNETNEEEDGAAVDLDAKQSKCVVIKTSTRQTVFLPVVGLVDPDKLKPGDLVGVNKDSYLILDMLPSEYDSRVKAMEVDEKPTEDYNDVGGLDKQVQELIEAVVRPMTHAHLFKALGIKPPKGVLMYGRMYSFYFIYNYYIFIILLYNHLSNHLFVLCILLLLLLCPFPLSLSPWYW